MDAVINCAAAYIHA